MSKIKVALFQPKEEKLVKITCPNCKRPIHVKPGMHRCGYCNALMKVEVQE